MAIGGFPGLENPFKRTIRSPVNPLDKSTIFSVYPKEIVERHPTISPGLFIVPPGTMDKPGVLTVGPSSWWREVGEQEPLLEITNSSIQIAEAVIRDYCNGLLACDMNMRMPGLFFLPGEVDLKKAQKEFDHMFKAAEAKQRAWYSELVTIGDILWARSQGNPLSIDDNMKIAARELNMDKDWLANTAALSMVRCVACGALRNPLFPICQACQVVVDPVKWKELNLSKVGA